MGRHIGPSRVDRMVTAVFSDPYHVLYLVEVKTKVKREMPTENSDGSYRVNKNAVEAMARPRLKKLPYHQSTFTDGYDLVGILVSHDDIMHRGRITWATEIEVTEAVEL